MLSKVLGTFIIVAVTLLINEHMVIFHIDNKTINKWSEYGKIQFVEVTHNDSTVYYKDGGIRVFKVKNHKPVLEKIIKK